MEILRNTFKLLQFLQHQAHAYLWYYESLNHSTQSQVLEPLTMNDIPQWKAIWSQMP